MIVAINNEFSNIHVPPPSSFLHFYERESIVERRTAQGWHGGFPQSDSSSFFHSINVTLKGD